MNFRHIMTASLLVLSAPVFAGPVNINAASAAELDRELVGVGPAIAQRIVAYRDTHGAFSESRELVAVKGIGERTLAKNADNIRLNDGE